MLTRSSSESATTRSNTRQVNDPETQELSGPALARDSGATSGTEQLDKARAL